MPVEPEGVHVDVASGSDSDTSASPTLYRRTFVGRERELKLLQAALEAACAGTGGLAMAVGEPGIGKSALCEQLIAFAAEHGVRALVGHCYEAGTASVPYMPFVEALRSYVMDANRDPLRAELGDGAASIAWLLPELSERLDIVPRPHGDPQDDRWRVLHALEGLLRAASFRQPLLLVLEDLHDADRDTLDVLLHVTRRLQDARLLVVGTYRDIEVDRVHPLSPALADLRRVSNFLRLGLQGLSVDEVHRMYVALRGQDIPRSHAQAVYQQTEGNPLFVQELLRYLVESGVGVRDDGQYVSAVDSRLEAAVPEGLRDVIGKRLTRLHERTNHVLALASVIGRDFRLDVLRRVAALPEEELIAALVEAQDRAIINEERGGLGSVVFRFTHAFFRQTLYEEIFAARRIRWHQQVADALETVHARRLDEHAAELAEHFAQSADEANLAKTIHYSRLGASWAMKQAAYGEAQRMLRQALQAQDLLDPEDRQTRCDLLLLLGEAMLPAEHPSRVAETVAQEAFRLAESLGDSQRASRASVQALDAWFRAGGDTPSGIEEWIKRADQYASIGTAERVFADLHLGWLTMTESRIRGGAYIRQAVEEARQLGDDRVFMAAAGYAVQYLRSVPDLQLAESLSRQVSQGSGIAIRSAELAMGLLAAGRVLLACGDRQAAEHAWRALARLSAERHDLTVDLWARGLEPTLRSPMGSSRKRSRWRNKRLLLPGSMDSRRARRCWAAPRCWVFSAPGRFSIWAAIQAAALA